VSVDVSTEVIIAKPRELVARFSADPDNAPRWYVNIKSVEWETEPPLRIGSKIAFVAQFLGRRLAYTYEVIEYVAEERFVMCTSQRPFPMETAYTWTSIGNESTRMTLRNRGAPSGFSRLLTPFMSAAMRKTNRKDLDALKRLLESHSGAGPIPNLI